MRTVPSPAPFGTGVATPDANSGRAKFDFVWRFWWSRGQVDEASRWYERAFAVGDGASETARARGLFGAAHMAEARGDLARTREEFQRAADLLRRGGETRWLVLALAHLGGTYDADPRRAESIYLEALELAEASGDTRGAAIAKGNLGYHLFERGDEQRAVVLIEEALASHRALADVYGIAACLSNLAEFALRRGDLGAAAANLRESLELSYSIRDTLYSTWPRPSSSPSTLWARTCPNAEPPPASASCRSIRRCCRRPGTAAGRCKEKRSLAGTFHGRYRALMFGESACSNGTSRPANA